MDGASRRWCAVASVSLGQESPDGALCSNQVQSSAGQPSLVLVHKNSSFSGGGGRGSNRGQGANGGFSDARYSKQLHRFVIGCDAMRFTVRDFSAAHTKLFLLHFVFHCAARVYAILAGQLLVTAASICLFGTNPELASWMHRPGLGAAVPIASLIMSTVAWIIMCVSTEARRASPVKWQILALFTLGEALSVGFVSSFYQFRSVVSAMMATALATTGISLYTVYNKNSKFDLSQWGATLSSFGLIFVVYGLIQILQMVGVLPAGFLPYNDMAYGLIGATLFSCYLAYHTKLIVAGKNSKYQMNEKDYIFGASTFVVVKIARSLLVGMTRRPNSKRSLLTFALHLFSISFLAQ